MHEDQFMKLYRYMQKEFGEIRAELHSTNKRVNDVYSLIDGVAKRLDDDSTEQALINHYHHAWIGQLARSTRTTLAPEQ